MKLKNAVVFITGTNRGLGRAFAEAALAAGAAISRQIKQSLSTPAPAYAG